MITYEVLMWALAFIGWVLGASMTVAFYAYFQPLHLKEIELGECGGIFVFWPVLAAIGLLGMIVAPFLIGLRGVSRFVGKKRKNY